MDLTYLEVPIGALDTASDPTNLPPGGLTIADNCSADTPGIYEHRKGYNDITPPAPQTTIRLAGLGNALCLVQGVNGELRVYEGQFGGSPKWRTADGNVSVAQTAQQNVRVDSGVDIVKMSVAVANGVKVDCWIDSGDFVKCQLTSVATGAIISANNTLASGSFFKAVRAVAAGTGVYIVFSSASAQVIKAVYVNCTTFAVGAATTLFSGANVDATLAPFDLTPLDATDVVLVWKPNSAAVRAARITASTHTVNANQQITSFAETVDGPIGCMCASGDFGAALYHSTGGGGMRAIIFHPSSMVGLVGPFTVEAVTSPIAVNCSIVRQQAGIAMAVWDRAANGIVKGYTQWAVVTSAGAVGSLGIARNVQLISKAWLYGSKIFATVYSKAPLQQTFFTLSIDTGIYAVHAMHAYRTAYSAASVTNVLSDVASPSAGVFLFNGALGFKSLASGTANAALATFTADLAAATRCAPVNAIGMLGFAGGIATTFDGLNLAEMNFLQYPEITQATPGAVGASGMDNGTYSYVAVFESPDTMGNVARSTTAVPVQATTSAGAGLGKVTLVIDQLHMTARASLGGAGGGRPGKISLFRTLAGGTAYHYVTSVALDQSTANVTIVDQAHDSTISSNRVLYTDGGVLDREPPPPSLQFVLHKNRIWTISSADRKVLAYSGELGPGEAPWFSSLQQVRIDAGGDISAIASMDDKLVIFKSDRIFKIYGSGMNALGQANDLSAPAPVNTDAGALDWRSLVPMGDGTMYRNLKGLQLLSRGEESGYIGAPVEVYVDAAANVTAAVLLADAREVRFELDTGKKAVYNYNTRRWTTHTNYLGGVAVDAVVVGGRYYWATAAGAVYQEKLSTDLNPYLDPASTFAPMHIQLGWLAPAGRQGLARVRKMLLLAQRLDPHDLTITTTVNYLPGSPLIVSFSDDDLSGFPQEQVRVSLTSEKVQSVRIDVIDAAALNGNTASGQGYRLRGLGFMAGIKKGAFDKRMVNAAKR